ncbi:MAG TPA: EamA family transporter [Candidatus Sulfotelmatobacter sp.]|jgi:uncharacterized membrane protein|nr:EamA family transporter [Candidatus Sulfotelmatobacter sp.]
MSWIIYVIAAIGTGALADFFRKFGSAIKDPFLDNLLFQASAFITAIILYMLFSRKEVPNINVINFVILGGICVSLFTTFFFKALTLGPGVSTVAPLIRAGGIITVALLGVILLHEKCSWQLVGGVLLASGGIYLLFLNK